MALLEYGYNKEYNKIIKIINNAAIRSLNRAGKSAASTVSGSIRSSYNIKKKDLDDILKHHKANYDTPIYTVTIPSVGIPLIEFGPPKPKQFGIRKRQTGKRKKKKIGINPNAGVKVTVIKKKRHLYQQAFIATMAYGKGIFKRRRRSSRRGDVFMLYGAQSSQLFGSDKMVDLFTKQAIEVFAKNFFRDVKFKLSQ